MTVKQLKQELEKYDDKAEVVVVKWETGAEYDASIGSDDPDEGTRYCRIGY